MSVANFSLHCSLMDGWVLLWVISRGVSWIVGILFLECAVRADVRLCPNSSQSAVDYSSQLWTRCSMVLI
jgi:hypothetical protein